MRGVLASIKSIFIKGEASRDHAPIFKQLSLKIFNGNLESISPFFFAHSVFKIILRFMAHLKIESAIRMCQYQKINSRG